MNNEARVAELMNNKDFTDALSKCTTPEETSEFLETYGISITAEELVKAAEMIGEKEELDEAALDNVAGGFGGLGAALIIVAVGAWAISGYVQGVKDGLNSCKKKCKA